MKKISDLPIHDRPREKLQHKGAAALSDPELMAILLGSGTKGHEVMERPKVRSSKLRIDERLYES